MLKKDQHDNKFIIFSQGRSGSNLLTDLLNCHPDIFCEDEIFHKNLVRRKLFFPMLYIRGQTVKVKEKNYGFQLKPLHLIKSTFISPEKIMTTLHKNGWKIIYLQRRNLLRQVISIMIGMQRQQWHGTQKEPFVKYNFFIDSKKLIKEIQRRENLTLQQKKMLAHISSNFERNYEDDLLKSEQHQKTADRVFEYLGLDSVPVKTKLIKASSDRLSDMIVNYEEIVSTISKTKYAKFLDEK